MTQEALKLALEALKKFHYAMIDAGVLDRQEVLNEGFTAATAIKEALAQPETYWKRIAYIKEEMLRVSYEENKTLKEALAQHDSVQAKPEPEQEPVAWLYESPMPDGSIFAGASAERLTIGVGVTPDTKETPLYTTPPQRTWVGLTDEERNYIWNTVGNSDSHGDVDGRSGRDVMSAIEAKLKQKNGFAEEKNT